MPSTSVQAAAWMTTSGLLPAARASRVAFGQVNRDVDTGIRSKTERDDRRPKSPHRGDEQSAKLTASASHEYALPRQLAYPLRRRRHANGRPAAGGSPVGAVGIVRRRLRGQ